MDYTFSQLEEFIKNLYSNMGILSPEDIDMYSIATELEIWIHEHPGISQAVKVNGLYSIVLNQDLSESEKWEEFGHELCHPLKHVGNQHKLPPLFKQLQEFQATNFMYHFCVPTFMLMKLELPKYKHQAINLICLEFNVTKQFATKRFEMYLNKINEFKYFKELSKHKETPNEINSNEVIQLEQEIEPITEEDLKIAPEHYKRILISPRTRLYVTKAEAEIYESNKELFEQITVIDVDHLSPSQVIRSTIRSIPRFVKIRDRFFENKAYEEKLKKSVKGNV